MGTALDNRQVFAAVRSDMDKMTEQFQAALPAHIPVERFKRVLMTAVQNNPDIAIKTSQQSLWNAAMRAAQDGLLPDGREGAIVQYGSEAQWLPMIAGLRKKVRNSGDIATWDVQAVYENDEFDFSLGDDPYIKHKPALSNRGKLIGAYSVATLKSGEKSREVMGIDEVEGIRSKSRAKNGPWNDKIFYPEMVKKTVARRHSKVLPMSTDLDDLLRRDDALYDFDGKADAAAGTGDADRKNRTARGLAEIAAMGAADGIEDAEVVAQDGPAQKTDDGGYDDPPQAEAPPPPNDSEIEEAYQAGIRAHGQGRRRDAAPAKARSHPVLEAAWQRGWDAGADQEG